jgi:hypothetical protein
MAEAERCPTCDQEDCATDVRRYRALRQAAIDDGCRLEQEGKIDGPEHIAAVEKMTRNYNMLNVTLRDCHTNRVDWRQRAIDATAEVTRLRAALGEALAGWFALWTSDNNDNPPDELQRLMRENGIELEYAYGEWRTLAGKET